MLREPIEQHIRISSQDMEDYDYDNLSEQGMTATAFELTNFCQADKIEIKYLMHNDAEQGREILGSKYKDDLADKYANRKWAIVKETYKDLEYQIAPYGGEIKRYTLYHNGKQKAEMKVFDIKSTNLFSAEENYEDGEFIHDLFFFFDIESDEAWIFNENIMKELKRISTHYKRKLEEQDEYAYLMKHTFSYWERLYVPKEERGKGYAEILMRYALNEARGGLMGDIVDILLSSVWDFSMDNKDTPKQKSLNNYYVKFFERNNMFAEVLENDVIVASGVPYIPEWNEEDD